MDSEQITVSSTDREYKKKRVEELGSTLAKIRARVKANRGSAAKNDDEVQSSGGSKLSEDSERTALTTKLEEDRVRFSKHQSEKAKIKEAMDQIMIDREEQKIVEKQLQEAIAKVTAPAPELPPLIKQRIMDLETSVETLKERLYEKDKVLSSKSQALTVLHNQLMQRSQEHAERAMAITQEISALKEDFGKREENWKKEMLRLKSREEELEQKLAEKESHTADVESLQLELALIRQSLSDSSIKNEEFSNKLETMNKINFKLKAQLKAVKQERDKFKESLESSGGVEALKNQIAVLEEEKESLQSASLRADTLEEEMKKMKESLKHLTEEKEALLKGLDEANKATDDQISVVEQLKMALKEVEEQKISAEMRSIEVEEKLEMLQSSTSRQMEQLLSEISLVKGQFDEQNILIDSLNNKLSLKDQEIADIKGNNFPAEVETETRLKEIESYNSELVEKIRELQLKCEGHEQAAVQLNESLNERNETNNQLRSKYDQVVASLDYTKKIVENLQLENDKLRSIESSLRKEKQSNEGVAVNTESKEDPNLAQKFKKLAANYKIRTKLCQELEEKLKNLNNVLEEKDKTMSLLSEQETELKSEIDTLKNKEQALSLELENVQSKNHKLLAIIEDLTPKLEALEAERSAALINVDKMNKAFEELKEWKEGDSKLLKEHVTSVNSMASHVLLLEDELGKLQSIVNEKNTVIGDLETERKKLVEDMKNSEVELERLRALYQQESVKNQNVLTNLEGLESEMLVSRKEMDMIAEQLDNVTKNYNMCLGNLQERENYIEALEQDIIGMKSKMYNLESGIEDKHRMLQERGNQLSAKLEQAEILRHAYDKYQVEMEKKFKLMEENEKSLKTNMLMLQNEIESLKNSNSELMKEKEAYEVEKSKMASEISTLNDIRNSYNSTLDRIEVLNEELKQVMDDFEAKNQELIKLSEERADLFNKLTDLEEAYSDLKSQLSISEEVTNRLQSESAEKDSLINELQNEILNLRAVVGEEKRNSESKVNTEADVASPQKEQNVAMFSWNQHSQQSGVIKGDGDGIISELEEKKKSLEAAQREIDNLQSILNSKLSEKDSEITLLQEQVNKLLLDKSVSDSDLKSPSEDSLVKKDQDVQVFSWDQHSHEVNKDDEEGWGWIGAEAHLEQDHKHSEALQIQTLTQRVKELEEEQKSLTDKLASSKIKCVKLIKKLKEMEAINEQSKKERMVGFSDLDFALQEELRSQLDKLELKNKELSNEINALKSEKENLLKKVEVFSNANDQLIEMKERQDIEVQMWQKRSAELKNELQGLQWTIEELKSDRPSHNKGEDELSEKFNALVVENEELQRIICNFKDGRPIGSPEIAVELNSLNEELKKLKEIRIKEKETYDSETKKANEEIDALEFQIDVLTKEKQELNEKLMQSINLKQEEISVLSAQIQTLNDENEKLKEKLASSVNVVQESDPLKNSELEEQLNIANEEIRLLKMAIDEKSIENDNVKVQLTELKKETEQLLEKIQALAIENSQLKEHMESYSKQLMTSQKESEDFDVLNNQLKNTRNELVTLQTKIDFLESNNNNLQEQLKTINESAAFEIAQHVDNLRKSSEVIKDLENGLIFVRGILNSLETCIDDLVSKMQISTISNDIVEKLKEVVNIVCSELNKNKYLEKEISVLKEELAKLTKNEECPVPSLEDAASLPVFKGFSTFTNNPFDNISEINTSPQSSKIPESSLDTTNYKNIISKLEEEKNSYQNEIKDLNNHISGLQAHLNKINIDFTKQSDEMKSKLERSEAEINHWKEQVNSLNQDINLLVQRHNQEIEDLRTNEERSREKLLEIEENYQNTLLNKEQENINLRQSLSEKEQQFTNSINELNSLQTQYGSISQQIFSLENRLRDLTKENEELQGELDKSKSNENTVIEKQKEEIQELMARLEYMSQSQNIQRSENEEYLRSQLTEMSNHFKAFEASNSELQRVISNQADEISNLKRSISELEERKKYLESVISEKQKELENITRMSPQQENLLQQQPNYPVVNDAEIEKYVTLLKQKDLEIERVSKVLLDTQERLVQVQESKPNDKVLSLQFKLDQVLYTLHARDVRCDELTQEIMQLLEERDILQLRLSESLRENDILRKGNMNKPSSPSPELQNKLGELHQGYKRDPVVQLEMESRHNQQMNLYSQEEETKDDKDTSVDYGIFNWFFSSPTSSSSQQQ
nr:sporulation-specific protein 15 isoform X2 [Halyomorpha halys]